MVIWQSLHLMQMTYGGGLYEEGQIQVRPVRKEPFHKSHTHFFLLFFYSPKPKILNNNN